MRVRGWWVGELGTVVYSAEYLSIHEDVSTGGVPAASRAWARASRRGDSAARASAWEVSGGGVVLVRDVGALSVCSLTGHASSVPSSLGAARVDAIGLK